MDSAQVLRQLMRRIGLDREEVDERCRLLDWQARDGERLNQAAAAMDGATPLGSTGLITSTLMPRVMRSWTSLFCLVTSPLASAKKSRRVSAS